MKPFFLRTETVGRGEDGQVRGPRGGGRQAQQQCPPARPEVPQEGGCGGEAGREVRRGGGKVNEALTTNITSCENKGKSEMEYKLNTNYCLC